MSVATVNSHPSPAHSALAVGGTSAFVGVALATSISRSTGAISFAPKLGAVALAGTLAGGATYDIVRRMTDNNELATAAGLAVGAGAWAGARALIPHNPTSLVASALLGVMTVGVAIAFDSSAFSRK